MDVINHQQAAREAAREAAWMQANREELVERIARAIRADGSAQPLPGLHLYRHSLPLEQVYSVVEPSLCVVAQGSKEFLVGESRYRYDPLHYLLVTVDLPNVGQVLEASKERPFLSLRLDLTPTVVGEVMVETDHATRSAPRDSADVRAVSASLLDGHLLDAMVRVARLLDALDEAPVLLPLLTREIIYRLLRGEQGGRLRHLAILGGYSPLSLGGFFIKRPPEPDEPWTSCSSFWEPRTWLARFLARSDPAPTHPRGSTCRQS